MGFSAINLRQIAVTFNEEVASNTVNATNLRVYDAANNNQIAGVTVKLAADNKTAFLLNTYTQLKNYKVVVENVASKADATKKVAKTENTVQAVDTTLPTAEGVAVKSPKTLEITFSEPISDFPTAAGVTDKVKIDGINAYFATIDQTKMDTENKATVTLGTAMTVGDHKVVVAGLKDYAGLPVAEKEFTVTVVADTTAPAVESATATVKDKVTVKFNKPVDASTVTENTNIKVFEGTTQKNIASKTTKDNQTFEFTMTNELGLASIVDASIKVKGVKDAYGNEIKEEQVFKFTAADDQVAPAVTEVKVNADNTLEVTFSEDVIDFAGKTDVVELYNKDNKKVVTTFTIASKTIDSKPSLKVYTISMSNGATLAGNHTLKFVKEKVKDNSVRGNYLAEATQAIVFNDKVAPKYVSAVFVNEATGTDFNNDGDVLDSKVTIYFDKVMDPGTLTNAANYLLGGSPLADVKGASLAAAADNKSVTITINRTTPDTQLAFTADSNNGLKLIALKDVAGNTLDSSQVNQAITLTAFSDSDTFANIIDTAKVEAIAKNQIKVYAAGSVLIDSIDPNKVKFDKNGTAYPTLQVTGVTLAADKKSAVLSLNSNLGADAKIGTDAVTLCADVDAVKTTTGVKSQVVSSGSGATIIDKIKPTVQPVDGKFEVAGDTISVKFDEALANITGNELTVKDSAGNLLVPETDYTASNTTDSAVIAIKITKVGFNSVVSVSLANNVALKDKATAANFVNDFAPVESKTAVVIPTAEEAAAALVAAYEALALDTDANIKTALDSMGGTKEGATVAVNALTAGATKTALEGRITVKDAAIKTAATIDEAKTTISADTIAKATGQTATATVVVKNAADVTLNTALTGDYAVTYAWEVTAATPAAANAVASSETTDTVTITVTTTDLTASPVKLKVTVAQSAITNTFDKTVDMTVNLD